MFDIEESLHLAIHAGGQGKHDTCIVYLKDVLRQQPDHALALYLLAVQHAEIGMQERAIGGLKKALSLQPGLEVARFQLGLLLIDRNRSAEAVEQFAVLGASEDHALRLYAKGLAEVAQERWSSACEKVEAGLAHAAPGAPLTALMRTVLANVRKRAQPGDSDPGTPTDQAALGAYRQSSL